MASEMEKDIQPKLWELIWAKITGPTAEMVIAEYEREWRQSVRVNGDGSLRRRICPLPKRYRDEGQ